MKMRYLAAAAAAACVTAAPASAAVEFAGSTTGCFGLGCSAGTTATTGGLTFNAGTFDATSNNSGFAALGGVGFGGNLGSFTLTNALASYSGPFTLLVDFTMPGTGGTTAMATLTGSVDTSGGGAVVNFGTTPYSITTNDGTQFSLSITNPINVYPGSTTAITANLQAVPEAATWAMMLVGFAGMGLTMRSRRRPTLAQVA